VYTASVDGAGKVGLYRLEIGCSAGTGKLRVAGGIEGAMKESTQALRSLAEPLQVAMDNGAHRALVPIENKRNFLDVPSDIVEQVDPIFYSDPMTAAMKALGLK
jgi:predicted ATP-dependent Lon-type protease